MKAGDIMTVGAAMVRPDTTIEHAAHMMVEHKVSGLPVIDAHGKLVGIVTERDLLRRAEIGTERHRPRWIEFWLQTEELAEEYAHEHGRKVSDVMSRDVVSVDADAELGDVVDLLEKHGIKRVPVVRDDKVVGIVSRANLVVALSRRMGEIPQSVVGDLEIRKSILDEIESKSWSPAGTVDIIVRDGVVTLNGTVRDSHVQDALRVAAENAPGVVRVEDNLGVVNLPAGYI